MNAQAAAAVEVPLNKGIHALRNGGVLPVDSRRSDIFDVDIGIQWRIIVFRISGAFWQRPFDFPLGTPRELGLLLFFTLLFLLSFLE